MPRFKSSFRNLRPVSNDAEVSSSTFRKAIQVKGDTQKFPPSQKNCTRVESSHRNPSQLTPLKGNHFDEDSKHHPC